jgi:5'-3' exonuclease
MKIALIDADVCAFQAALLAEKPVDWGDGLHTLHAYENEAEEKFDAMVAAIVEAIGADKVILAFTDSVNWRKGVLPTYKGNRAATRKPMLLGHLTRRASELHETFVRPTLEGDDVLGILATRSGKDEMVICSIDKDMKTIPGTYYDFKNKKFYEISEGAADYYHMYQTLIGDTTDGYSGCPGCGPKTAEKILEPFVDENKHDSSFDLAGAWEAVIKTYTKAKLGPTEALVQARVARICRSSDYDFKKKEVILWTPPSPSAAI